MLQNEHLLAIMGPDTAENDTPRARRTFANIELGLLNFREFVKRQS